MNNTNYGLKFKQLRKERNFSLDTASRDITSKSALYYWEKGEGDMAFSKVIAMLDRMHIKVTELLLDSQDSYINIDDINNAYSANDNKRLETLTRQKLSKSRKNIYNNQDLLEAAIACNYLKSATRETLFSSAELERLEELLSEIREWHYKDIFDFGNTLFLLPDKRIYGLARLLIEKFRQKQSLNYDKWNHAALRTILNAILALFYTDCSLAQKLVLELDLINISDNFAFEKLQLKFDHEFLLYLKTRDASRIENSFLPVLGYLGMDHLKEGLTNAFTQLKKIYENK